MIIVNESKYDIVVVSDDRAKVIKKEYSLAKVPFPSSIYMRLGKSLMAFYNVESDVDTIKIKNSKIDNEVEVEVIK